MTSENKMTCLVEAMVKHKIQESFLDDGLLETLGYSFEDYEFEWPIVFKRFMTEPDDDDEWDALEKRCVEIGRECFVSTLGKLRDALVMIETALG